MRSKKKKINPKMISLVTLCVESIGQDKLTENDKKVMQNILYNERCSDRAILRLAHLEDSHKGNLVYKNKYIMLREVLEEFNDTLADELQAEVSDSNNYTLKGFVKMLLNEWIPKWIKDKIMDVRDIMILELDVRNLNII